MMELNLLKHNSITPKQAIDLFGKVVRTKQVNGGGITVSKVIGYDAKHNQLLGKVIEGCNSARYPNTAGFELKFHKFAIISDEMFERAVVGFYKKDMDFDRLGYIDRLFPDKYKIQ